MEGGGPVGPHGDDAGAVPAPAEARSVVLVSASGEPSASVPPGPGRRDHLGPQPVRGPLSALAHLGILPCRPAAWGLVRTRPRQARLVPGAQSSCPRSPHLAGCCCPCDPGRRRPPPRRRSDPSTFLSSADDASSPLSLSAGRTSPAVVPQASIPATLQFLEPRPCLVEPPSLASMTGKQRHLSSSRPPSLRSASLSTLGTMEHSPRPSANRRPTRALSSAVVRLVGAVHEAALDRIRIRRGNGRLALRHPYPQVVS